MSYAKIDLPIEVGTLRAVWSNVTIETDDFVHFYMEDQLMQLEISDSFLRSLGQETAF